MNIVKYIVVAVAALGIGLAGGYMYGNSKGVEKGIAQEKKAQEEARQKALEDAAKALNPFSQTESNPLSPVNPFENINVNPFK